MKLKQFYKYLKSDRTGIILFSILTVFNALFEGASIGLVMPALQFVENGNVEGIWGFLKSIFNSLGMTLSFPLILFAILLMVILKQVTGYYQKWYETRIREGFVVRLRNEVFDKVLNADISYFHNKKIGNLVDTLTIETYNAGSTLFVLIRMFSSSIVTLIYLGLIMVISWQMTLIAFVIISFATLVINYRIRESADYGKKLVNLSNSFNDFVVEKLSGIRIIKASATEKKEIQRLNEISNNIATYNNYSALNSIKIVAVFELIVLSAVLFIFYYSVQILKMSIATLAVFMLVVVRVIPLTIAVNSYRNERASHMGSFENVIQIINEGEEWTKIKNGRVPFNGLKKSIEFDNVSFAYSSGNEVLKEINIFIKKGETVAIAGASGAGKSTLADLIMRLHDVTSGKILIDGIDIREYDFFSLRKGIGFVSQDVFLFNDTVGANISYGSDNANEFDIINAAKIAHAHEFILKLSEEYNTILGDRGVKLSGGQRQRLALARAILKKPQILILDEATSALDSESERMIQKSIEKIEHNYTFIAIAHRLSTIQHADKIIVLEGGQKVEEGTHEELLSKGGHYAKYYSLQYSEDSEHKRDVPVII